VLNRIIEQRGKLEHIRLDNGPEFISHHLQTWCEEKQIEMKYNQPGKPTQNAFIEIKKWKYLKRIIERLSF
jgi:putative transposase